MPSLPRSRPLLAVVAVAAVAALLVGAAWAWWTFAGPDRFDELTLARPGDDVVVRPPASDGSADGPGPSTSPGPSESPDPLSWPDDTRTFLLFSVGSRGMTAAEAQRLGINDLAVRGQDGLTDVLMLLLVSESAQAAQLVSVPRDTWVSARGQKINATFNTDGAAALVDDVEQLLHVPVHHLVQVSFVGFARVVDAVGPVRVAVDRPLRDHESGLLLDAAGCWALDGPAALAFVRSRHTQTLSEGRWVSDRSASDFGRIGRQQQLLSALWDQVRGPQLPLRVPALLSVVSDEVVVDDGMGVGQLRSLASGLSALSSGQVPMRTLDVVGERIGGQAALVPVPGELGVLRERLRSWEPGPSGPVGAEMASSGWMSGSRC